MKINITLTRKEALNLLVCLAVLEYISLIPKNKKIAKGLYKEIDKQVFK